MSGENDIVLNLSAYMDDCPLQIDDKNTEIQLQMPYLGLKPGVYSMKVHIAQNSLTLFDAIESFNNVLHGIDGHLAFVLADIRLFARRKTINDNGAILAAHDEFQLVLRDLDQLVVDSAGSLYVLSAELAPVPARVEHRHVPIEVVVA